MKQRNNHSRLFFIEFLIVLFFFLIVSTVCLRLFAHAHRITDRADALSHAQTIASSIAETLLASSGSTEVRNDLFPEIQPGADPHTFLLHYDSSFEPCSEQDATYTAAVVQDDQIAITVEDCRRQELLYRLTFSLHEPLTRGEVLS